MRNYIILILTIFTYSQLCFSDSSGSHLHFNQVDRNDKKANIDENMAVEVSKNQVFKLVTKGILSRDWLKSSPLEAIKKDFLGKLEWVIKIKNDNEVINRKILFVFLSLDGKFIAANFTGK
jgi:hypothetical protein